MATLEIFGHLNEVEQYRDSLQRFRVSGMSVVTFVRHTVEPDVVAQAVGRNAVELLAGSTTYSSKFKSPSRLVYSRPMQMKRESFEPLVNHRLRVTSPASQNLIWVRDSPIAICAVPLRLHTHALVQEFGRNLEESAGLTMHDPWSIRDIVNFFASVQLGEYNDALALGSADVLSMHGISTTDSCAIDGVIGVDIWSISGTQCYDSSRPFRGLEDSAKYSWALATILNHSSDHIVNHFYDDVSPAEVYQQVKSGHCFMRDHAIFTNPSCVLEVTHFGPWAPPRSWDRLRDYGFDSSTLFLLGSALARNWSYREIAERSSDRLLRLSRSDSMALEVAEREHDRALAGLQLLDVLRAQHLALRESRSQTIDHALQHSLGDRIYEEAATRRLEALREVAMDVRSQQKQTSYQEGIGRLTFAATMLAVLVIPTALAQIELWLGSRAWAPLGVSVFIMVAALIFTTRAASARNQSPR